MYVLKIISLLVISVSAVIFSSVSAMHPLEARGMNTNDLIFIRGKSFRRTGETGETGKTTRISPQNAATPSYWFQQCSDHNNTSCSQTWKQRYWLSWKFYKTGGPIFFMLGGEQNANGMVDAFIWRKYAAKYAAALVVLEHRFYGESFPTLDTSYKSMQLLHSRQALADAAKFIQWVKDYFSLQSAKLVVFGGSYPGNLAAWFKQKYPTLVNVAVSSSAPLEARFEFPEYYRTVSEVIYEVDSKCYDKIFGAFSCMEKLVHGFTCSESDAKSSYNDKSQLSPALHECFGYNLQDEFQKQVFFYNIGSKWATNSPGTESTKKCPSLDQQEGDDVIDNYAKYRVATGESPATCPNNKRSGVSSTPPRDEVLEFIRSSEGEARDGKSWVWQTCNEFGYYQIADSYYQLFGYDWNTMIDIFRCTSAFPDAQFTKENIQARIKATNAYYKGKQYDGNCTIFINGAWDPWHPLGFNHQSETSSRNTVISIPRSEHCEDMQNNPNASVEMLTAQNNIQSLIGKYLNDPAC